MIVLRGIMDYFRPVVAGSEGSPGCRSSELELDKTSISLFLRPRRFSAEGFIHIYIHI